LAALSGSASVPLPGGWGAHATATRSHTRLLYDVNGTMSDFTNVPEGRDLSASVIWSYGDVGELKVFAIDQWNQLGVVVDEPSYSGAFEADERHDMMVASWRDRLGAVRPSISVSTAGAGREQSFGVFVLEATERVDQLRAHAAIETSSGWTFTAGADLERRTSRFRGSLPEDDHDVEPGAPRSSFDSRIRGERVGTFAEADASASGRLRVTAGARADHSSLTGRWTLDPRLAAAYRLTGAITVTGAWGMYHQAPAPFFFEPDVGDPALGPMRAVHWILGAQAGSGELLLRTEAYVKTYRDLAQWTRSNDVARGGTGSSRGVDLFLRWPAIGGFGGRAAYSWIRARRTDPDAGIEARSPFEVSRVGSIVLEQRFGSSWTVASAYRASTGRPVTPVLSATHDVERDIWVPEYGEPMAERLPDFRRLDLSVSRLLSITGADLTVLFLGLTNALDRENLFGYRYSEDYTERIPVRSQFKRSIYFGASITF
ncbi:MAG: TonB-dependent receptor plug domain-containing protein, partial [Longimicrobiales bacterium]